MKNTKHKLTLYIILLLFATGFFIRMQILGYNKEFPVQAKSSDATFHIIMSQEIFTRFGFLPEYISQGYENIANVQPPLLYMTANIVSKITGEKIWNAAAIIIAAISSLIIPCAYLLGKKIHSQNAGIISAAIATIPFPLTILDSIKYGFYTTIIAQTLLFIQVLLLIYYYEKPETKIIILIGILSIFQALTHFSETVILVPFAIIIIILAKKRTEKNMECTKKQQVKKELAKDLIIYLTLTTIPFIIMIREILSVWLKIKGLGFHLIPATPKTLPFLIKIMKETSLMHINLVILLLGVAGAIILITNSIQNQKKEQINTYLLISIYFMFFAYLLPYFYDGAEYYIKLRYFILLLLIPLIAIGTETMVAKACTHIARRYMNFQKKQKHWKAERIETLSALVIISVILSLGIINLAFYMKNAYEPLNKEKYETLLWIQNNTASDAKIVCLNGFYEWTCLFSKRAGFEADINWLRKNWSIEQTKIKGNWMGHSLNLPEKSNNFIYDSGRNITRINYLEEYADIEDFDVIIIENKADKEINKAILQEIKIKKNIKIIYDKNEVQIIRIM